MYDRSLIELGRGVSHMVVKPPFPHHLIRLLQQIVNVAVFDLINIQDSFENGPDQVHGFFLLCLDCPVLFLYKLVLSLQHLELLFDVSNGVLGLLQVL